MSVRVLISGQDPSLPGGMAQYVGGLCAYLDTVPNVQAHFLNETKVKGRVGMFSAGPAAAVRESGRLLRAWGRALATVRPDVAHLHMAHGLSVWEKALMARIACRRGVPAVVHLHGAGMDELLAAMPPWQRRRLASALQPPARIVTLSERMRAEVCRCLSGVRANVICNAVTLADPAAPLSPMPTFGFLGFMDGRKGEGALIQALADAQIPPARLRLAGDGPGRVPAEALAERLGLAGRVEFLGLVSGAAKVEFLRSIDVLCLPSQAENLPLALLEAMGWGRTVIATRVGGVPELIEEGEDGWLVPPGDGVALAQALGEAYRTPTEVARRGRAAWKTVRDCYTWQQTGPQIVRLYEEMSGRGARNP